MKRKIVNMGTIGIVVIILLVGVLNYKQAAETKMKKIETEENRVRENKTNYTNEQDSSNICEMTEEEAAKAVLITYIQIVTMIMTQRLFLLCSRENGIFIPNAGKK